MGRRKLSLKDFSELGTFIIVTDEDADAEELTKLIKWCKIVSLPEARHFGTDPVLTAAALDGVLNLATELANFPPHTILFKSRPDAFADLRPGEYEGSDSTCVVHANGTIVITAPTTLAVYELYEHIQLFNA